MARFWDRLDSKTGSLSPSERENPAPAIRLGLRFGLEHR